MDDGTKLIEMKKEVEDAKNNVTRINGSIDTLQKRLKASFKCNSIAEAKTLLEEKTIELNTNKEKLHENMVTLEKAYDWNF